MEQILGTVLGVVVALAAFWGYIQATFQPKEMANVQNQNLNEKLDGISRDLRDFRADVSTKLDAQMVRTTVGELADRLVEVFEVRGSSGKSSH